MPNWVTNRIEIKAKKEKVDKIKEYVKGEENGFDFNKIIPMPKTLHITSGSVESSSVQYALMKMNENERENTISMLKSIETSFYGNYYEKFFRREYNEEELNEYASKYEPNEVDKELGIKTLEDLGKTYINNVLQYGYDTWYDWSCDKWGTKWNACEPYFEDNIIVFDSAWSCPLPILKALSEKFKGVEFYVEYADEDIGNNCGSFTLINGEMENYVEGDTEFALELKGWDKEEYYSEVED